MTWEKDPITPLFAQIGNYPAPYSDSISNFYAILIVNYIWHTVIIYHLFTLCLVPNYLRKHIKDKTKAK